MLKTYAAGQATAAIDIFSSLIELRESNAIEERPRGVADDWGRWTVAAFQIT